MIFMDEDKDMEMEIGNAEEDVYSEEGRENLVEDGEIEPWEEGFMEGADMDGQKGKCANCGRVLFKDSTYEKEIDGKDMFFCSEKCIEKYEEKHEDNI